MYFWSSLRRNVSRTDAPWEPPERRAVVGAAEERFTRNDEDDYYWAGRRKRHRLTTSAVETKASAVQFCNFDLESSKV